MSASASQDILRTVNQIRLNNESSFITGTQKLAKAIGENRVQGCMKSAQKKTKVLDRYFWVWGRCS